MQIPKSQVTQLPDGQNVGQVSSISQKFADDFGGLALNADKWDVNVITPGMTVNVANSVLSVVMGTTASAETHLLSKTVVSCPVDFYAVLNTSQRIVGNNVWFEFVEVDDSGVPVVNPNNAAEWNNRCALAFLTSATAGAAELQVISDGSPAASAPVQTTGWTALTTAHECHLELRAQDLFGFNVGVDTNAARGASLRMSRSMIDPAKAYKLRLRFKNEAVAPATSTTFNVLRVLVNDVQELTTEITGGRGDNTPGKGVATNIVGSSTLPMQGANADNSSNTANPVPIAGLMTSAAGGPTAGTTARNGVAQMDLARRLIVQPIGTPQSHVSGRITALATTGETSLFAVPGATLRTVVQTITIANHDTATCIVDIRDALTGTIRETVRVPANSTVQLQWPNGRPCAALNAAVTVQLRAATTTTGVDISGSAYSTTA